MSADDRGFCEDADSDTEGLGWSLRTCISDKPPAPDDADAASAWTTL